MTRTTLCCAVALLASACAAEVEQKGAEAEQNEASASGEIPQSSAKTAGPEKEAAFPRTLEEFPAEMVSHWDSSTSDEFACSDISDEIIRIDAKEMAFYEAGFFPEAITAEAANRVRVEGTLEGVDVNRKDTYTLEIKDGGKTLVLTGEDDEPWTYRKCDEVREAPL